MDSQDRKYVVVAIVILVIVGISVAFVLNPGGYANGYSPTMTMRYERSAPGDYNFTVVGITENDVRWSDIQLEISPTGNYAATLPSTTAYIVPGDVVVFSNLTPETTYAITLKYVPTDAATYQVMLTAS